MHKLSTHDNNVIKPLHIPNEGSLNDLNKVSGKRIKWLCDDIDGYGLLVFPRDLNEYGDDIGDSVIFDINNSNLYTNNIMGFIGIGDTQLKIGSRFDDGRDDLFMQYMLEKVFAINMMELQYSFNHESIFDFIIFLFPFFLKKALEQGLYKAYRTYERNDLKVRGVLDVNRHIRLNYPTPTAVAYKTREQTYDNDITQLIRHTIEYIRRTPYGDAILNNDEETKTCVSMISEATGSYSTKDRVQVINHNLRPRIHPYYSEYEPLRKLCLQILKHEEIKYGDDKDKVYGVIFDGAWLWEEYLATLVEPLGINHPKNRSGKGGYPLFTNNKAWRYPDYYADGIVLDAKYKRYGQSQIWEADREDLAQIISYMYVEKAQIGVILCPGQNLISQSIADLRGYGKQMARLTLPISKAASYKDFRAEMYKTEYSFKSAIYELWSKALQG